MRLAGIMALCGGVLSVLAGAAFAQTPPFVSVPVYGNWCGPNQPANMAFAAPPVDMLDAACMRHDYCVAQRGPFDCGCDLGLLRELRATPWPNPVIRNDARAIYDAIALVPCRSAQGTALKQGLFGADLFDDVMSGRGTPADVLERWRRLMLGR